MQQLKSVIHRDFSVPIGVRPEILRGNIAVAAGDFQNANGIIKRHPAVSREIAVAESRPCLERGDGADVTGGRDPPEERTEDAQDAEEKHLDPSTLLKEFGLHFSSV